MSRKVRNRLREIVDTVFNGNEKAVADAAGVQPSTVMRILAGQIKNPRVGTLEKLASGVGVPLKWLTGEMRAFPTHINQHLPRWLYLLKAYTVHRQREDREWLKGVQTSNRAIQQMIADALAPRGFHEISTNLQLAVQRGGRISDLHLKTHRVAYEAWSLRLRGLVLELKKRDDVRQKRS